ncbi:transglycosylase domain-containing protein [Magnetovirga frankeli]|uniref:transglycosylase domain-containing protein n=1 Tax=Magnetovirga frankeli TaxID=947516 RepID=UPI001293CF40|nr:transglycosylase domain-containing protein [gamma proteobacterium SS-5]
MTYELLLALFLALSPYLDQAPADSDTALYQLNGEQAVGLARGACRSLMDSPAVTLFGVPLGQFIDEMIGSVPPDQVAAIFAEDFKPKLAKLGLDYDQSIAFYLSICHPQPSAAHLAAPERIDAALDILKQTRKDILLHLGRQPFGSKRHRSVFRLANGEVVFDSARDGEGDWQLLEKIPIKLQQALIAVEDKQFYRHKGIDINSLIRAANKSLEGNYQGGSTITQQLVKNLYYYQQQKQRPERDNPRLRRKLGELIIARELELQWGKKAILEAYFNVVNFGRGSRGAAAAAQLLFGKPLARLNLGQLATLAAMPKRPGALPFSAHFEELKGRQHYVLEQMVQEGYISQRDADKHRLQAYPFIDQEAAQGQQLLPYRHYLRNAQLDPWLDYYWQDFAVQATLALHPGIQALAEQALVQGLSRYERRFQGKAPKDGVPEVQGAVVVMDHHSGDVLALQGGTPWVHQDGKLVANEYDRASREYRQPGSTLKPFTYLMALENGLTPSDQIPDYGLQLPLLSPFDQPWRPSNYSREEGGSHSLRYGLEHSRNLMTAWLLEMTHIGNYAYDDPYDSNPAKALDAVRRLSLEFGIYCSQAEIKQDQCPSPMAAPVRHYPFILGAQETSLLRMVTAYARIANGGVPIKPRFIKRFELALGDEGGQQQALDSPLNKNAQFRRVAVDPRSLFQLKSLLMGVTQRGTAARLARFGDKVAGKTGTTDDYRDAWFIGFTSSLTLGVWVGYVDQRSLGPGATGSQVALPIFETLLEGLLKGEPQRDHLSHFPAYAEHHSLLREPPAGLVSLALDPVSGCAQQDIGARSQIEYFKQENSFLVDSASCGLGYAHYSSLGGDLFQANALDSLGDPFEFRFPDETHEAEPWRKRDDGHFGSSSWIMGDTP